MGFKRTTEGRVFFQGADDSANDEESLEQGSSSQRPSLPSQGSQQTQLQILTLLKSLNDKLKITQAERNRMRTELETYRAVIEDLENKAARSEITLSEIEQKVSRKENAEARAAEAEKLARETMKELEETRRLLLEIESKTDRADKNISTLASVQKSQSEKIAVRLKESEDKQQELGGKLEETITGQARLGRKVDKAIEDRARFMRKIERIEETVIQTRDALNARAMVLLTDQNPAAQTAVEMPAEAIQSSGAAALPFWRRMEIPSAGIIPIIAVVLLAGWLFSTAQKPSLPDFSAFDANIFNRDDAQEAQESSPVTAPVTAPVEEARQPAPPPEWNVEEDTAAFAPEEQLTEPSAPQAAPSEAAIVDDIGTVNVNDDAQMLALLEKNPDALAEQLNAIEPGEATAEEALPVDVPPQEERVAMVQERAARPPAPPITAPVIPAPALSSMRPDSGLPASVKPIEAQAFDGVPEAQHDLAAVYTAGHAGVKQNYERAAFWFRQAADQGVANARYNLGVLYHQGLGVKKDIEEALRWYKSAADLGHPEAQYNLGIAYIEGIGVPYDPVQAGLNFERAANSGVMEAAYNLGLIYENGLLGQPKPDVALMWYKLAADRGSPEAKSALEQLAKTLGIGLDEVNRLVENLRKAKEPAAESKPAAPAPGKTSAAEPAPAPVQEEAPPALAEIAAAPPVDESAARQGEEQVVVARVQEYLMRIGLYPGPADGVIGPLTEDAIRSYQAANDLYVDGHPTQDLLSHMIAMEEPAQALRVNN